MMKKRFKILTSIAMVISLGLIGGVSLFGKAAPAKQANAASVPTGVYVDISACIWSTTWGATLSNVKAHFFTGETGYTTWPGTSVESVVVNESTYGYVEVPSGATQVIFNAWGGDNKDQNKTESLTIPTDGKLLFKVTSNETSAVQYGSWSNLDVIYPTSGLLTPSDSTARVFINNDSAHSDWKSAQLGIRAWGETASTYNDRPVTASVYVVSWFNGNYGGVHYAYADIPTDCKAFQVVRLSGDAATASVWSYSVSITKADTSFSCVYYLSGGSTDYMNPTTGAAKDGHAGSVLLQKVIEAYDTCSSSTYNGYGDATELNTNFYSLGDEYAIGVTATSRGGSSATISSHFDAMIERKAYGTSTNNTSFIADFQAFDSAIIVAIATTTVTAFGLFIFLKKRKHS